MFAYCPLKALAGRSRICIALSPRNEIKATVIRIYRPIIGNKSLVALHVNEIIRKSLHLFCLPANTEIVLKKKILKYLSPGQRYNKSQPSQLTLFGFEICLEFFYRWETKAT